MRQIIIIVFYFLFSSFNVTLRANTPSISTSFYYAEEGDNLKNILEYKIGFPQDLLYGENKLYSKIKSWNPSITNWDSIKAGSEIYLEYPYGTVLTPKQQEKEEIVEDEEEVVEDEEEDLEDEEEVVKEQAKNKVETKKLFSLFTFFTASQGTFKESLDAIGETLEVSSSQNSPVSLGFGGMYFSALEYSYSGSIYFSSLTGSIAADTSQEVEIKPEIGVNFYYNYNLLKKGFSLYTGVDHERFSTFNIDEIITGSTDYYTRTHNITFLTGGITKFFTLGNQKFLFKASLSRSIRSSSSSSPTLINTKDTYSGFKYLLYLNYKLPLNFLAHVILKQHLLNGPTKLNILRLGFGIAYKFF